MAIKYLSSEDMETVIPKLLTRRTYMDAIKIASLCFPKLEDTENVKVTYDNFLSGKVLYESDGILVRLLIYFVLYDCHNEPIGISGLYKDEKIDDEYWLGWFGIHPSYRRSGYGKLVIRHISELAKLLGGKKLKLYTSDAEENRHIIEYYKNLGFSHESKSNFQGEAVCILSCSIF